MGKNKKWEKVENWIKQEIGKSMKGKKIGNKKSRKSEKVGKRRK